MKIGIFGDSYADSGMALGKHGWNQQLAKEFVVTNRGRSGTSLWWAYNKFLEQFHDYDVIVFSFTSYSRWPIAPNKEEHQAWNIGYVRENDNFLDKLNPYFWDIFSEDLLRHLNYSIHKAVTEMCLKHNKYLINVVPFLDDDDHGPDFGPLYNEFPYIMGLDKVSRMEEVYADGQLQNTCKYIKRTKLLEYRHCHLNPSNNKIIADWMIDCIKNRKFTEVFNAVTYQGWVKHDPIDSEMLALTLLRDNK